MLDETKLKFVSEIWSFSADYINEVVKRQTMVAQKVTRCKRQGVACCVFSASTRQMLAVEFNGPHFAFPFEENDGSLPAYIPCKNIVGNCGCEHAEQKAISYFNNKVDAKFFPLIFATDLNCCLPCAQAMVSCGFVSSFVYRTLVSRYAGIPYLIEKGIDVYRLPQESK